MTWPGSPTSMRRSTSTPSGASAATASVAVTLLAPEGPGPRRVPHAGLAPGAEEPLGEEAVALRPEDDAVGPRLGGDGADDVAGLADLDAPIDLDTVGRERGDGLGRGV